MDWFLHRLPPSEDHTALPEPLKRRGAMWTKHDVVLGVGDVDYFALMQHIPVPQLCYDLDLIMELVHSLVLTGDLYNLNFIIHLLSLCEGWNRPSWSSLRRLLAIPTSS